MFAWGIHENGDISPWQYRSTCYLIFRGINATVRFFLFSFSTAGPCPAGAADAWSQILFYPHLGVVSRQEWLHWNVSLTLAVLCFPQGGRRGSQSEASQAQLLVVVSFWQLSLRGLLHPIHGAQQCSAWSPAPPSGRSSTQGKRTASRLPSVPSILHLRGAL